MNERSPAFTPVDRNSVALKIAGLYLLIGGAWIWFSDQLASAVASSSAMFATLSMLKGWGYVVVTALLLYWLIRRHIVELRAGEQQFRAVIEHSADVIALLAADGNILYESPSATRVLGYQPEEMVGRSAFYFLHPDDHAAGAELFGQARQQPRTPVTGHIRYRHKDGVWCWLEITATSLLDEPSVQAIVINYRDITERKRAEAALQRREQQLEEAQQVAHIGNWEWDIRTDTTTWSNEMYQLYDMGPQSPTFNYETFLARMIPDDRERVMQITQQAFQTHQPFGFDYRITTAKDGVRWMHGRAEVLVDETGQPIRLRGTAQDITERKRMEAALRDKVAALQMLNEIDREIMAATERQNILDLVCRHAAELMHTQKSAIATRTAPDEFEMTASFGLRDPGSASLEFARQWQAGLMHPAGLATHPALALNDILADDPYMPEFRARENIHALAIAHLVAGKDLLGVLMVFDGAPRAWSFDELQLLDLLAGQAAIAIEKISLYEVARSRALHLETLNTIGQAITSTLDLHRILAILLENVARAAEVEACSVALVEAGTGDLVFQQAAGRAGWVVVGMRVKPGQGIAGWVAEHRQPAMILDVVSDPRFYGHIDLATGYATRNLACVPMLAHDRIIGVIELINKRSGAFGKEDLRLLEAVAAQAAVAIENARLFETERSARQRLEILYGVGQAINSNLDAEAILVRLTDEAMRVTHATHGSAIVARLDLDRFDRHSLRGYSPEQVEHARHLFLPLDQGLNCRAYRTRQTVYLPDVSTDPDYFALIPETRSELVVPILRSGQVLANLDLQSPEVDAFRDVDAEFLHALIDQVAIALENARLFGDTRRRLDEMAVVSQVALIGAAGRPFDEAVSRAVDGMYKLWSDSNVSFLFVDESSQVLRLHPASRGVSLELVADFHVSLNQGIIGWVARERQPARVGDVTLDPRYIVGMPGARSEMAAPLLVGERAIGVINVECPWPNAYSGDDLRVLAALSSQLATIFEKARLDAALAEHAATLEQRVAERTAELRQAEAKYRTLVEQTPAVTYTSALDERFSTLYISPQVEALIDFSPEAWLADPELWLKQLHPDDRQRVLDELTYATKTGQVFISEYRLLAHEGRTVWIRNEGRLVRDESGQPVCVQGIMLDVTERKQAEEDMRHALEKEKELSELKSRFISMASHEFRTPLATILSSTELLEHYGARWTEEKKLVHFRRIELAIHNMTHLLEDVLILGRAEAGRLEFNPVSLDLVEYCHDLVEEMQLSAGSKHTLQFVADVASAEAHMDEKLLRQILTNLLSNAIKYSPEGGPVYLKITCQAGWATFQVRDEGIGIPEEAQARLFETFHRAKNVGNIPGTGLGLSIVKKSVDLHDGMIAVASQAGSGTTVTVTLPMRIKP